MAKRKAAPTVGGKGKRTKVTGNETADQLISTAPSKLALDPRMATWPVTTFKDNVAHIYSWNVNGIRSVMGKNDLQKFLKSHSPDILCINETKIDADKLEKENLGKSLMPETYLHFWNCCKASSGYAGTAIFTKVKPVDVKFDLGIYKHDLEGRTITIEYPNFILVACYVPNAGQKLDRLDYRTKEWDADFRKYLKGLETSRNKAVILCGDLNVAHEEIDIFNPKGNQKSAGFTPQERKEFTNFLNLGFVDSFRKLHPEEVKYSYWNMRSNARKENKGWRLDYFAVSASLMPAIVESDMVPEIMGSDHCPLKFFLDLGKVVAPAAGKAAAVEAPKEEAKKPAEEGGKEEEKKKPASAKKASGAEGKKSGQKIDEKKAEAGKKSSEKAAPAGKASGGKQSGKKSGKKT